MSSVHIHLYRLSVCARQSSHKIPVCAPYSKFTKQSVFIILFLTQFFIYFIYEPHSTVHGMYLYECHTFKENVKNVIKKFHKIRIPLIL
jgi:hypothetical protein